ncbi:MAG: selenocysteine-specific translation elongation factor [Hyphomicrobiaceae bacterium]
MIITTAGHVDHGKTLLVKALTGVDTDRLPEEKKRGLTIDLGFAYLPIEGHETVGFIDVPGHERFIRNALCGLAGTDFILFIVAADDGPMPQTEEHLAIVDLLGKTNGAIALTKIDRVPPERARAVSQQITALFADTSLKDAPVFAVSAVTGAGIPALRDHLIAAGRERPLRPPSGNFRLAVDRAFDVVGAGFVVTGTVFSGSVSAGDKVVVAGLDIELRVRGIHAQNAKADAGRAGQRCALNLTGPGLRKNLISRGAWIAAEGVAAPVTRLDVELRAVAGLDAPVAHWTPVHVHLGADEVTGRIAVLEGDAIPPGSTSLAQLVLDRPLGAVFDDRFVVRDHAARNTLGGGRVLDIFPPVRGRAKPERLRWLHAMRETDHAAAFARALSMSPDGLDFGRFAVNRNLTHTELTEAIGAIEMRKITAGSLQLGFSPESWDRLRAAAVDRLAAWHATSPGAGGLGENQLFSGTGIRLAAPVQAAIASALVRDGVLAKGEFGVRLPSHRARLEPQDARIWQVIEPLFSGAGLRPLNIAEIVEATGLDVRRCEAVLVRAGRLGLVHRISKTRITTPAALIRLAAIAERAAGETKDGLIGVAEFRDAAGIGRNMSVEIVEYFDKLHFTERRGDRRRILHPAADLFGGR